MTDKQTKKDIKRGTTNRVADGATLMQEGNSAEDHAHIRKVTPFQTKKKEIFADPQYQADAIDPAREQRTTQRRRDKDVKPI